MAKALIFLYRQVLVEHLLCVELRKKLYWFVFFSDLNFKSKGQVKTLDHNLSIQKVNFGGNIKLILHSLNVW